MTPDSAVVEATASRAERSARTVPAMPTVNPTRDLFTDGEAPRPIPNDATPVRSVFPEDAGAGQGGSEAVVACGIREDSEVFTVDVVATIAKAPTGVLEYPFFVLDNRDRGQRNRVFEYKGTFIKIESDRGLPNSSDMELFAFLVTLGFHRAEAVGADAWVRQPMVEFSARDYFKFTHKSVGGKSVKLLHDSVERLFGAYIETNVQAGGNIHNSQFRLLTERHYIAKQRKTINPTSLEAAALAAHKGVVSYKIKFADWVTDAIVAKDVLSLGKNYFDIRTATGKRIYEIARKHCGRQGQWDVNMTTLYEKSGSSSTKRLFKNRVLQAIGDGTFPDYKIRLMGKAVNGDAKLRFELDWENNSIPDIPSRVKKRQKKAEVGLSPNVVEMMDTQYRIPSWQVYEWVEEFRVKLAREKKTVFDFDAQFVAWVVTERGVSQPA